MVAVFHKSLEDKFLQAAFRRPEEYFQFGSRRLRASSIHKRFERFVNLRETGIHPRVVPRDRRDEVGSARHGPSSSTLVME